MNIETGEIRQIPGQDGLNINPVWAPDGRSLAFISDRTGIANLFLYDLVAGTHHQLTNVVSGVAAITEYSPAITWARGADRLAFTYYENGDFTVWSVTNPRALKGAAFQPRVEEPTTVAAPEPAAMLPASPEQTSTYRAQGGARPSRELSASELERADVSTTVAALREDPRFGLPDTTRFREYAYRPRFRADYIAQTDIGYTPNYYGTNGFAGGTTIVFSDLLGNHLIAVSAQVNGRIQDASLFLGYGNLGRRFQYTTGAFIQPIIFPQDNGTVTRVGPGQDRVSFRFARFVQRNVFVVGMYPLNRFTRFETGVQFNSISRQTLVYSFDVFANGFATAGNIDTEDREPTLNFVSPTAAWVTDNALFGPTSPLAGRRARAEVTPTVGTIQKVDYLADLRNYLPIRLGTLTFATRLLGSFAIGRDEAIFPKYIGRPDFIRGYDDANLFGTAVECNQFLGANVSGRASEACSTVELVGSRAIVGNAELRFPIIRRFDIGTFFGLPPVDGVLFYDAGLAWNKGQDVSLRKPDNYNVDLHRYPLTSWGGGLRVNLFNVAILRFDYAIPMAKDDRSGVWTFSLGPGF
jgi:hypothetical protein